MMSEAAAISTAMGAEAAGAPHRAAGGNPEFGRRLSSSDVWGEAERLLLRRPTKRESDAAGQQRLRGELGRLATVDDPLDDLRGEKGKPY